MKHIKATTALQWIPHCAFIWWSV